MKKGVVLASIILWAIYMAYPKQEPIVLSPIVSEVKAHVEEETIIETERWCEGEINSLFCNPEYKWDAKTMIAICMIENGYQYNKVWNPRMVFNGNSNGSVDKGICSINSIHGFDPQLLLEPEYNINAAYKVWLQQSYEAWAIYNNGKYNLAFQWLD